MAHTKTTPKQNKTLSLNVEGIRETQGLTKKDMAENMGISPTAYSSLARSPIQVRLSTIHALMKMGMTLDEIFIEQ